MRFMFKRRIMIVLLIARMHSLKDSMIWRWRGRCAIKDLKSSMCLIIWTGRSTSTALTVLTKAMLITMLNTQTNVRLRLPILIERLKLISFPTWELWLGFRAILLRCMMFAITCTGLTWVALTLCLNWVMTTSETSKALTVCMSGANTKPQTSNSQCPLLNFSSSLMSFLKLSQVGRIGAIKQYSISTLLVKCSLSSFSTALIKSICTRSSKPSGSKIWWLSRHPLHLSS